MEIMSLFLSQKTKSVMASHIWRTIFLQETVEEVGSQAASLPLDTTQQPLLQWKTRAHFSICSFSPENPLSTLHQPIRYAQIIHHLEAKLTIKSAKGGTKRAQLNWPEVHPSLLFLSPDERSRSYNISWSAMAISKYKAVNDKAKTSHTAIVQRQHKKTTKQSITSVKLKLPQWERYPWLLKLRPKGEITLQQLD